jgi:hypothetical protein
MTARTGNGKNKCSGNGKNRQPQILRDDKQKNRQQQRQRRNTGVSPLRRQSAPPSVEMTFFWKVGEEGGLVEMTTFWKVGKKVGSVERRICKRVGRKIAANEE